MKRNSRYLLCSVKQKSVVQKLDQNDKSKFKYERRPYHQMRKRGLPPFELDKLGVEFK